MFLPEKGYQRILIITFYVFLVLASAYIFLKYLFVCILPFTVAFLIAGSTRKCVLFLYSKFRMSRFFSVLITTLAILGIVLALIYWLFSSAFAELSGLTVYLNEENLTEMLSELSDSLFNTLSAYFPDIAQRLQPQILTISKNIGEVIVGIIEKFLPLLANAALGVIKTFPKILLFIAVTLLSLFYFGCDYEKITHFIGIQLTVKQKKFAYELKNQFFVTIFNTIRAYAILIFITFAELLTGFLIIGIPYATVFAAVIALIDILPVLGTGTILLPWSLILIINRNMKTGLCILALYVIITIVRQIAEPKVLGNSLGLHPLVTLMSMYFGVKLAGLSGLFIFPFVVIIIKNLNEKDCIHLYKNPEPTNEEKNMLTKKKLHGYKKTNFRE